MEIPSAFVDEVCAGNDIVELISAYTPLKRAGTSYVGLCPFHSEKSPSFSVSAEKQVYHCFGCGAGGGLISFVKQAENLTYPEAVEWLADRAGLAMPEQSEQERARAKHRDRLKLCNRTAARFFYDALWRNENAGVQQYFARRGLHRRTMNNFGLGFAPDSFDSLMRFMKDKGFSEQELLDAGLVSRNDRGNIFDKFRNRVMFPIIDKRGEVVAFGGRVLDDSKPKYLNSPETMLFSKSRNLFALNLAKKSKLPYFMLAEGYMDVIALHQAGFDSAVASLGTSLTEEQARMIAGCTDKVIIVYDADNAGQTATRRAITILKKCDIAVNVLSIPGAKDPDEFIREKGADAFRALLSHSEEHNAYQLSRLAEGFDLEQDEQRVAFLQKAAVQLAEIESEIEREVYVGRAAKLAGVSAAAMQNEVAQAVKQQAKRQKAALRREVRSPVSRAQPKDRALAYTDIKSAKAEEQVIRLLFSAQELVPQAEQQLPPEWFSSAVLRKIYEKIIALDREGRLVAVPAFEELLENNEMSLLGGILEQSAGNANQKQALQEAIDQIHIRRVRDGSEQQADEDPLLTFGRMKRKSAGGK